VRFQRVSCALAGAALIVALSGAPSSAQGLFDLLFGSFKRQSGPSQSYADPNQAPGSHDGARDGGFGGRGLVYCVRLCDGRHFPLHNHTGASAAEMCRSFCPYAPTQIFSGSKIDHAVAPGGKRYSELPNAFVYREKLVGDCTCDGKSPTGLVRLDSRDDPTLRSGDFVATGSGLMSYRVDARGAQFSTISNAPGLSAAMRQQLTATRVAPGRNVEEAPDPEADGELAMSRNVPQRDQASR
jgi:hypothetical protein